MRVGMNDDDDTVDEVVATDARVHLEDMGGAYMLIIEEGGKHLHLTIPSRRGKRAFIYEEYDE